MYQTAKFVVAEFFRQHHKLMKQNKCDKSEPIKRILPGIMHSNQQYNASANLTTSLDETIIIYMLGEKKE